MSTDRDTLHAVITANVLVNEQKQPATPLLAHMGMVETLRAVFADIDPVRQYGLLLQLLTLAKAPGFSSESFASALNYLREGQRYGVPPSQWGLKELMRESINE